MSSLLLSIVIAMSAAAADAGPRDSPAPSPAPAERTRIEVWAEADTSGSVRYRYRVIHRRKAEIAEIHIGLGHDLDEPELSAPPVGWDATESPCPPAMKAPPDEGRVVRMDRGR
jgi:hypothetical protein